MSDIHCKKGSSLMKLSNTRKINERFSHFMEQRQLNQRIGLGISGPASTDEIVFDDYANLKKYARHFQQTMQHQGITYSEDESVIAMMINSIAAQQLNLPEGELPFPAILIDDIIRESCVFHRGCFDENAYLKNIHFEDQSLGHFQLTHDSFAKYETVMYTVPVSKHKGIMIPRIGTFDHRFHYPCIKEDGQTWMSVTPNEILTMEKPIADAHGNVLTLGCGMGYYAYMVSEKETVEHITIVEKEPAVIELFKTYILPQFSHKDKVSIVQSDAFEYMNTLEDGNFDYCFADIWIGNNDTIPYLKLKSICKKFKQMTMSYWIEDSLVATMMGFVYILILREYYKNNHISAPELTGLPEEEAFKLHYLDNLLKDVEIRYPDQIDYYLDYKNILNLI